MGHTNDYGQLFTELYTFISKVLKGSLQSAVIFK